MIGIEGIHEAVKRLKCCPWLHDKLTCVVRKSNTKFGDCMSVKDFIDAQHIYHSTLGTPFTKVFLDNWLSQNNIQRHIAVNIPGYLSAVMITEITNYILTLPLRLAQKLVKTMDLRIIEPPESFPDYKLNLI